MTDPRFLMTLDVQPYGPSEPVSFIVCEDWPGVSLQALLRHGPLPGLDAAWLVNEMASALAPLHEQGLSHGELNPATVFVTTNGAVRIKGFMLFAALAGHMTSDPQASERADVIAIGRLLYATVVGSWPDDTTMAPPRTYGLPPAQWREDVLQPPRKARSGVAPQLDSICMRILQPRDDMTPLRTAQAISIALKRYLGTTDASEDLARPVKACLESSSDPRTDFGNGQPPPAQPPVPFTPGATETSDERSARSSSNRFGVGQVARFVARWPRWWLVGPLLVVALLVVLVLRSCAPLPSGNNPPADLPITAVTEMDAKTDGGDGKEHPDQVPLATDGQTDTCWTTEQYPASYIPDKKPGVGLVFDLGESHHLSTLSLTLGTVPVGMSVMAPSDQRLDAPPLGSVDDWQILKTVTVDASPQTIILPADTATRFVMLYFTSLPTATDRSDRVQGVVCEVTATG